MKLLQTILNSGCLLFFCSSLTWADVYEKGSKVTEFQANDQHGNAFTFDAASTKYLLVSFDMETGKKANAALSAQGAEFLTKQNAVYVANIHGMPGIGRFFAMPKMRKYPHRIVLGDDANLLTPYPQQAGKVTVLTLSRGTVQDIRYWDPSSESVVELLK